MWSIKNILQPTDSDPQFEVTLFRSGNLVTGAPFLTD